MGSSETVSRQADTGREQGRDGTTASAAGRWARAAARLVGLFLVVLLVVGVGVGVTPAEPQAPVYSAAERTQLDAEGRYRALAEDAREAAAADPALADALLAVAADLAAQAEAVALPRSTEPPEGSTSSDPTSPNASPGATDSSGSTDASGSSDASGPSDPSEPSNPPVPAPPPADAAGVLALLRDSALRSLSDAVGAEPGPARVLASAGANQWRHAVLLGALLGADAGLPPADAVPPGDLVGSRGLFAAVAPAPATPVAPSAPDTGPSGPAVPVRPVLSRRSLHCVRSHRLRRDAPRA